jgi:hypothetical protein
MTHSHHIRTHRIAGFALAFLLALAAAGVMPLRAAEPRFAAQPPSPLDLARHFESLTEGGPFNPVRAYSLDRASADAAARADETPAPLTSPDRGLR